MSNKTAANALKKKIFLNCVVKLKALWTTLSMRQTIECLQSEASPVSVIQTATGVPSCPQKSAQLSDETCKFSLGLIKHLFILMEFNCTTVTLYLLPWNYSTKGLEFFGPQTLYTQGLTWAQIQKSSPPLWINVYSVETFCGFVNPKSL